VRELSVGQHKHSIKIVLICHAENISQNIPQAEKSTVSTCGAIYHSNSIINERERKYF